jgi:hypothetical protein
VFQSETHSRASRPSIKQRIQQIAARQASANPANEMSTESTFVFERAKSRADRVDLARRAALARSVARRAGAGRPRPGPTPAQRDSWRRGEAEIRWPSPQAIRRPFRPRSSESSSSVRLDPCAPSDGPSDAKRTKRLRERGLRGSWPLQAHASAHGLTSVEPGAILGRGPGRRPCHASVGRGRGLGMLDRVY